MAFEKKVAELHNKIDCSYRIKDRIGNVGETYDFVVLDTDEEGKDPLILRRPF